MAHTRNFAPALGLATLAAMGLAAVPQAARAQNITVSNADFETPNLPQNSGSNYQYNVPTGPGQGWTFDGRSGIAGVNSAFGNSNDPGDATQVGFLQSTSATDIGSFSQTLSGFTPGDTYSVSFDAGPRNNNLQTVTASLFGASYTIRPLGSAYNRYTISGIAATNATGTLTFSGGAVTSDSTVFVDNVGVAPDAPAAIVNGDFSAPNIGANGIHYFGGPDTVGEWTYRSNAGLVNGSGNGFGAPLAAGQQAAFVQSHGTASQLAAGFQSGQVYTLNFAASFRPGGGPNGAPNDVNDFEVVLDPTLADDGTVISPGTILGTFVPTSSQAFDPFSTLPFTTSTGDHTVAFIGLDTLGGDRSSFITNVSLSAIAAPEPSQFAGLGIGLLGLAGLALRARKRA